MAWGVRLATSFALLFIVAQASAQVSTREAIFTTADPSVCSHAKLYFNRTNGTLWANDGLGGTGCAQINAGGGGGAPTNASYITNTPNATLSAEQALSALATGIVKNTTATGVLSIAVAGTDYLAPTGNGSGLTGITASQVGLGSVTNDVQAKAAIVPNTAPSAGQVLAGNAGGTAYAPVTISGSGATFSLSSAGVLTVSAIPNASLSNSAITINSTSVSLGGTRTLTLASADFVNQGTTTTVLHGNAAGNPSFGAVALSSDVSGDLPFANLAQASGASVLLGRGSAAGSGDFQEITLGSGLSMSGTTLSASGSGLPATDTTEIVQGSGDSTKRIRIEVDGLTTSTTRVITSPDSNTTLPVISQVVTIAGPTAARTYTFPDAAATIARTDAGQTFTGVNTFTSPKVVTDISDTNGNEVFKITATASAVNEFTVANAAASGRPSLSVTGSDANIDIDLLPKGTGAVNIGAAPDVTISRIAANVLGVPWEQQTSAHSFLGSDGTNATTTFSSTGLSVTVSSGRKYTFRLVAFLSDSLAADGAKVDFNGGTATATNFRVHCTAFDAALGLSSQATALSTAFTVGTFTGSGMFECYGSLEPSASGTFIPRYAQNAHTTGTLTIARGSHLLLTDMP